ncbi:RICIN domain-containing protein [Atopobium fossor]|uniref:RICIN domain-containing protein n=1 Tax=Atopobium fossor TaxID=39487 RepID=UPI000423F3A4|nr:RICIN domain-containing protein [Atopobium fossor]
MKHLDRQGINKTLRALRALLFGVSLLVVLGLPSTALATEISTGVVLASPDTTTSDVVVKKGTAADQANAVVEEAVSTTEPATADKADNAESEDATTSAAPEAPKQDDQPASEERSAAPVAADSAASAADGLVAGDTYYIRSAIDSDKVLDVSGGSAANGANVQLWDKNNTAAQRWKLIRSGQYYMLINEGSNKALDIYAGRVFNEANVQQYQTNYTNAQKWILRRMTDGSFAIVSVQDPRYALDLYAGKTANGTNIQMFMYAGGSNQRWWLENASASLREAKQAQDADRLPEGDYLIETNVTTGKAMDVDYPTADSGSSVLLWQTTRHKTQVWHVSYDKEGLAKLTNKYSGKVLDAYGGKAANGINVQQFNSNDGRAQRWLIVKMADGTHKILSAIDPSYAIDLHGSYTANNTNIELFAVHNGANQRWRFISLDIAVPGTQPDVAGSLESDAMYTIASAQNTDYVMDVAGGKTDNGTNAQLYSANGTSSQAFSFVSAGNGYYLLKSARGNIALASTDGIPTSGNNAQFWQVNTTDENLQFAIIRNADGTYSFRNVATGLLLDVQGSLRSGANLYLTSFSANPSDTQRFSLQKITNIIPSGLFTLNAAGNNSMALTTDGSALSIASNSKRLNQKWAIKKVEGKDNTYTLQSLDSGKFLTTMNNRVAFSGSSTTSAAHWLVSFNGANLQFKNVLSGTVLDINNSKYTSGTSVAVWKAHGGVNQQWIIVQAIELENGTYELMSGVGNNMALDVDNASKEDGANVQIYTSNHTGAQKWNVYRLSSGSYVIININSGKTLDLQNSQVKNGSNILQFRHTGNSNQHWYVEWNAKGYFVLRSALDPNFVIDVAGDKAANQTNVQLDKYRGSSAQGWNFKQVSSFGNNDDNQQYNGTFRLYLDAGHGYSAPKGWDPGAIGNGYREADLTHELVNLIAQRLDKKGIDYRKSEADGVNYDRRQEAAASHGCTTLLSIHFNSNPNASASGFESYRHTYNAEPGSIDLQRYMHQALRASVGLSDRGMKTQEIAVISGKKGHLPATLLEIAFVSNAYDMRVYQQRKYIIADALADAIEKYAKDFFKGNSPEPDVPYPGFDEGPNNDVPFTPDYSSDDSSQPLPPTEEDLSAQTYTIMGSSSVTANQMVALFKQSGKTYPSSVYTRYGASSIEEFCGLVIQEAAAEGVRAEVVFAQAMHETGWLQFGGDVKNWQCNFAGLGATGNGVQGEDFSTYGSQAVRYGLRAQVQHLKGYASTDALNNACVDNRFKYLTNKRGSAPTISGLTGTWAMDPNYGNALFDLVKRLRAMPSR